MEVKKMYELANAYTRSVAPTTPNFEDVVQIAVINTWLYVCRTRGRWRWKLRKCVIDALRSFAKDDHVPSEKVYFQSTFDEGLVEVPGLRGKDLEFVKILIENRFEFDSVGQEVGLRKSNVFNKWKDLRMQLRKYI